MSTDIKPMTDEELAELDKAFDVGESGGLVSARTMKRREYWGLRERLRLADAVVESVSHQHGNLNESVYTQVCPECRAVAAYRAATGGKREAM